MYKLWHMEWINEATSIIIVQIPGRNAPTDPQRTLLLELATEDEYRECFNQWGEVLSFVPCRQGFEYILKSPLYISQLLRGYVTFKNELQETALELLNLKIMNNK